MLFETNFIKLKKIDINVLKKIIYTDNCKIIALLKVKTFRNIVQTLIYVRKIIVVFSYFEIVFLIHYITISIDKKNFFESNKLNISLYIYLTNVNFKNILIRNKSN